MPSVNLADLLPSFFALLDVRQLDACQALLAEARVAAHESVAALWLDYLEAILCTEQAPPRWDTADQLLHEILAANPPDALRARVHLELGLSADYQGDYRRALHHDHESLALFEKISDLVYQAKILKNLGIAHTRAFERGLVDRRALAQAQDCFTSSLALCQAVMDERLQATVEMHLGIVAKFQADWEQAKTWYTRCLEKFRHFDWPRFLALTLNNLGEVHYRLEQWTSALQCHREALDLLQHLPAPDAYEEADMQHNLALALQAAGDVRAAQRAFDRAIGLIEVIRSPLENEASRMGFFGTRIPYYESHIRFHLTQNHAPDALTLLEKAKSRAFVELLATRTRTGDMPTDAPWGDQIAQFTQANPLTAAQIQERLPCDTLLLEYVMAPEYACLFVVTHDQLLAIPLADNLHEILTTRTFEPRRHRVLRVAPDATGRLHHPWILAHLYRLLIEPVADQIAQYQRLCIVPYGPLHYIPFHALLSAADETTTSAPGAGQAPAEILSAPSATVLLDYCQTRPQGQGQGALVVSYGQNLRHAAREGTTIASRLHGTHLSGADATTAAVMAHASHYPVLHFACHGTFDPLSPLASGVELHDGRLTAAHVLQELRLQADLVVLSSCETGQSHVLRGDELMGLVRAFMAAGTPSVVVSLWKVDDLSTRLLMDTFYTALTSGTSSARALQQAQNDVRQLTTAELERRLCTAGMALADISVEIERLRLRAGVNQADAKPDEQRLFSHPYYWAAFMLVGGRLGS